MTTNSKAPIGHFRLMHSDNRSGETWGAGDFWSLQLALQIANGQTSQNLQCQIFDEHGKCLFPVFLEKN